MAVALDIYFMVKCPTDILVITSLCDQTSTHSILQCKSVFANKGTLLIFQYSLHTFPIVYLFYALITVSAYVLCIRILGA